jgi:hypothetical protein
MNSRRGVTATTDMEVVDLGIADLGIRELNKRWCRYLRRQGQSSVYMSIISLW